MVRGLGTTYLRYARDGVAVFDSDDEDEKIKRVDYFSCVRRIFLHITSSNRHYLHIGN